MSKQATRNRVQIVREVPAFVISSVQVEMAMAIEAKGGKPSFTVIDGLAFVASGTGGSDSYSTAANAAYQGLTRSLKYARHVFGEAVEIPDIYFYPEKGHSAGHFTDEAYGILQERLGSDVASIPGITAHELGHCLMCNRSPDKYIEVRSRNGELKEDLDYIVALALEEGRAVLFSGAVMGESFEKVRGAPLNVIFGALRHELGRLERRYEFDRKTNSVLKERRAEDDHEAAFIALRADIVSLGSLMQYGLLMLNGHDVDNTVRQAFSLSGEEMVGLLGANGPMHTGNDAPPVQLRTAQ